MLSIAWMVILGGHNIKKTSFENFRACWVVAPSDERGPLSLIQYPGVWRLDSGGSARGNSRIVGTAEHVFLLSTAERVFLLSTLDGLDRMF